MHRQLKRTGNAQIDAQPLYVAGRTLYVVAYTFEGGAPVCRVHALALGSLTDRLPPVVVAAVGTLSPTKTKYVFDPSVARARVALLLSHGRLYAAFGSLLVGKSSAFQRFRSCSYLITQNTQI